MTWLLRILKDVNLKHWLLHFILSELFFPKLHFFHIMWITFLKMLQGVLWTLQFSSVTQLCLTLCNPIDCSTPGFPVHHKVPEFTQTHVHWVGDAIQPFHPLSSPSPPAFHLSQHQSHECTKYWQLADIYIPYLLKWVKVARSYPVLWPHGL